MMSRDDSSAGGTDGSLDISRRQALSAVGIAGFAGLSSVTSGVVGGTTNHQAGISVIGNPAFVTDARGNQPPFNYNTLVFDPGPESIPLDEAVAGDDVFDNDLFRGLNDSRRLVTKPPEGYDPESGYDDSWEPVIWGEHSEVTGTVTLGDGGREVGVTVENGHPHGQYTIWVVKFAELENPEEFDQFVTPDGNGLVGFHNLGPKNGDRGTAGNGLRLDEVGDGELTVTQEGGSLTGIPGFREPDYPFVGDPDDYVQDITELGRISDDLRDEDEIHFVGAYHYDDNTWGVYPGPYHVNHFDARFQF